MGKRGSIRDRWPIYPSVSTQRYEVADDGCQIVGVCYQRLGVQGRLILEPLDDLDYLAPMALFDR